jgi:DNA processing protein
MLYDVALGLIPKIGDKLSKYLISYLGSAEAVFKANKKKLMSVPGIGQLVASEIIQANVLQKAESIIRKAEKEQVQLLFYTNPAYPKRLKELADAPSLLYYKGVQNLNAPRTVAIVGTRMASEYGKEITQNIVQELAKYDVVVISGLAYGIDIAAHKACLQNGVPTIGVMGSGIDIIYPFQHQKVALEMLEKGGLLTENSFGVKPEAPRFPERNRIIAGLCDALIVIETAQKGGTLITAEIAYSYNKEIYAVPGNLGLKSSEGSNKLIVQQKAQLFMSVSQIVQDLHWDEETPTQTNILPLNLSEDELEIVTVLLKDKELQMDELAWKTQIVINKLSSLLLMMEFKGLLKTLPGNKVKLTIGR